MCTMMSRIKCESCEKQAGEGVTGATDRTQLKALEEMLVGEVLHDLTRIHLFGNFKDTSVATVRVALT